jgi:hypothetical protein
MGFQRKLRRAVERARREGTIRAGRAYFLEVQHDAWCPRLVNGGACLCDAQVSQLRPAKDVVAEMRRRHSS